MRYILKEACVETIEEAIRAEKNGADRIELCSRLDLDGLTPDKELIANTAQILKIPVKVMIRPRPGDFIYSESEIKEMKESIRVCKKSNVKGVVFGILNEKNHLNLDQIKLLTKLAFPIEVTIHKAIDLTPDLIASLCELKKIKGITSILTSGGASTAIKGKDVLRKMIEIAGTSVTIIAAGKITNSNLKKVNAAIGANECHGRAIVDIS